MKPQESLGDGLTSARAMTVILFNAKIHMETHYGKEI